MTESVQTSCGCGSSARHGAGLCSLDGGVSAATSAFTALWSKLPEDRRTGLLREVLSDLRTGSVESQRSVRLRGGSCMTLSATSIRGSEGAGQVLLALGHCPMCTGDLQERIGALSTRERQVVELLTEGLSDGEIAERLDVRARTIGNCLSRVYSKLDVPNRAAAAAVYATAQTGGLRNTASGRFRIVRG